MYNKGHGEVKVDIMLLLIANNCWTRSFALGYWLFYFSSVFGLRWGKKTFAWKRFLKWVCMLPYLPLPLLGTSIFFWQSVNILCWTICWIKHRRHMIIALVMALPLRVYYLMRCTHNALWWVIMNSFDSTISYFGCISCLWQDLQDLFYWVVCIPFQYFTDCFFLLETWVARVLKVTVIPDCPVL